MYRRASDDALVLRLCEGCYENHLDYVCHRGPVAHANLVALALGIPLGGLDRVVILRDRPPASGGGAQRRWAQLSFCVWCGGDSGSGGAGVCV